MRFPAVVVGLLVIGVHFAANNQPTGGVRQLLWPRRQAGVRGALQGGALTLLACLAAVLGLAVTASAHAFLAASSPAAGARLQASPKVLTLNFTEPVSARGERVTLMASSGRAVAVGALSRSAGGAVLTVPLPLLAKGAYVVDWQVVSAADGHYSSGEFAFAVGDGGTLPELATESADVAWPEAVASYLVLAGLALAAGGLLGEEFVWGRLRAAGWSVRPPSVTGPVLAALLGGAGLFFLYTGALSRTAPRGHPGAVWSAALQSPAGELALGAIVLILYALLVSRLSRTRRPALFALVGAMTAIALRTHPASTPDWWGGAAIVVHVVLGLLWAGVLAHLALALRPGQASPEVAIEAVRRYARLALWTVALVLASGVAAALTQFHGWGQLWTTLYGNVLVAKLLLVTLALLLALLAHRMTFSRRRPLPMAGLGRRLLAEAGILGAVLGAAALLANAPPPVTAASAGTLLGPPPPSGPSLTLAGQAGWLEVYLTASAGELLLRVVAPGEYAPPGVTLPSADNPRGDAIFVRPPGTGGSAGLAPRPCGPGCFGVPYRWSPGSTQVRLRVAAKGWTGGTLTLDVPWPPLPQNPALLAQVVAAMTAQPSLGLDEQVTSGPGAAAQDSGTQSGIRFMASEPYGRQTTDVRPLPDGSLVIWEPGSWIWVRLWLDAQHRIRREVVVDPGHLIQRTFSYPRGSAAASASPAASPRVELK
jgi:copper transport protein